MSERGPVSGAVVGLALIGTIAAIAIGGKKPEEHPVNPAENAAALIQDWDANALDFDANASFRVLATLAPSEVQSTDLQDRLSTGWWLQRHIDTVATDLLAVGGYKDSEVDEMSVAEDVIPEDTQKAMKKAGYEFVPIPAVACDVIGELHLDPWDYTNHLPHDFDVRVDPHQPGAVVEIPLGESQVALSKKIGTDAYNRLPRLDFSEIPCDELPQLERTPHEPHVKMVY